MSLTLPVNTGALFVALGVDTNLPVRTAHDLALSYKGAAAVTATSLRGTTY